MVHGADRRFSTYNYEDAFHDQARGKALANAINLQVQEGDFVITAGFGTGGLAAMLAVKAGAGRVVHYEMDEETASAAVANGERNGMSDRISVVHTDPRLVEPPQPVQALIVDMGRVGCTDTPQVEIFKHFRPFMAPGGRVIPGRSVHGLRLINAPEKLYGIDMTRDARTARLPADINMSTRTDYLTVNFGSGELPTRVNTEVVVRGRPGGIATANAVQLDIGQHFAPGVHLRRITQSLWPLTVFLPEQIEIRPDEEYGISISYGIGKLPTAVEVSVRS